MEQIITILETWLTPISVIGGLVVLIAFTHKQGEKIGKLEGKMDVTCENVSNLIGRIDKLIDSKSN